VTSAQPRVPAGLPGGGRFAPAACAHVYGLLDALAREPEYAIARVASWADIAAAKSPAWSVSPADGPARVVVEPLVAPCPHGHVAPWSIRDCRPCAGADAPTALGDARPCRGRKAGGDRCTRRTTRRDRHGEPACHDHGGRTAAAA
jgi:hypothetical protein